MPPTPDSKTHPRARLWLIGVAILALLSAAALLVTFSSREPPFSRDPRFILTTTPRLGLPPNPTLKSRLFLSYIKLRRTFRTARPVITYSFPPTPTNRCSIHGMLNQCMDINGFLYVIAKDVAPGTVQFGHTNTMNGPQWVAAFTDALQAAKPEWWDSQTKSFRKENLVLLTNRPRIILVLPKEMVPEFQHSTALPPATPNTEN